MIRISNSGQTVSIFMDKQDMEDIQRYLRTDKFAMTYAPLERALVFVPGGAKINWSKLTEGYFFAYHNRKSMVMVPSFAQTEPRISFEEGKIKFILPTMLHAYERKNNQLGRKTRHIGRKKVHAAQVVPIRENKNSNANVLIVVSGKTLEFSIPHNELLDLTLEMAHKGYSVRA